MWVRSRTKDQDLVNLDHASRIFINPAPANAPGSGTRWLVSAYLAGQEMAIAVCESKEQAEGIKQLIEEGLRTGADHRDLMAIGGWRPDEDG